ncbi:hypothetical protein [Microbacterium sp. 77mftsu3.1]|uniref:hypothetical protein n=1 Tax=Microbacterium sp. 77mftsu3.1 TaxID=1761802 RepID=UPI000364A7E5|nr:hypothetical protein [Microbacterium sp. 77mftsu3.1]SDH54665.1 hypothetical protein SAMN04488590_3537 [Microbacterium sp. 77mftsu3.1]
MPESKDDRFAKRQKRLRVIMIVVGLVAAFAVVAPLAIPTFNGPATPEPDPMQTYLTP